MNITVKKVIIIICLNLGLVGPGNDVFAETASDRFVEFDLPANIILTSEEQAILKKHKKKSDVAYAIRQLQKLAEEALFRVPNPVETITYEGYVSNHPKRIRSVAHLQDMLSLRALTWAYKITGDRKYAVKGRAFLRAWSRTYIPTGNDVNENKLNICFYAFSVFENSFTTSERTEIAKWLETIGSLHIKLWHDKAYGNRAAKRVKLVLLASSVLRRTDWQQWAKEKMLFLIKESLNPDGTSKDLHARDAMHYHMSCVKAMLEISLIGRVLGMDFYSLETIRGASIRRSVNYMRPYIQGEKIHKEWINTRAALDRKRWEAGDPYYRPGKPWNPTEAYEMLLMASVFDSSLIPMIESMRSKVKQKDLLLEVIVKVVRDH